MIGMEQEEIKIKRKMLLFSMIKIFLPGFWFNGILNWTND
jgi:hypothetical protein